MKMKSRKRLILALFILDMLLLFACCIASYNARISYTTHTAEVCDITSGDVKGEPLVTFIDEDGELWQVYDESFCIGDKVELCIDAHDTPQLSDDEIINVTKTEE